MTRYRTRYCIGQVRTIEWVFPTHEDGDIEVSAQVRLTARPRAATPPRWDCGGEPPEPAEFELVSISPGLSVPFRNHVEEKMLERAHQEIHLWEYDPDA